MFSGFTSGHLSSKCNFKIVQMMFWTQLLYNMFSCFYLFVSYAFVSQKCLLRVEKDTWVIFNMIFSNRRSLITYNKGYGCFTSYYICIVSILLLIKGFVTPGTARSSSIV